MHFIAVILLVLWTSSSWAMGVIVKDGDTIKVAGVSYRLDGIDAPEFDQMCIDDHADPWSCGVEARDKLVQLIGKRDVKCEDLGPDKTYKNRHIGICAIAGETMSLNQRRPQYPSTPDEPMLYLPCTNRISFLLPSLKERNVRSNSFERCPSPLSTNV